MLQSIFSYAYSFAQLKVVCTWLTFSFVTHHPQNVSIIIKKLRRSPEDIMNMVVDMDTTVLTQGTVCLNMVCSVLCCVFPLRNTSRYCQALIWYLVLLIRNIIISNYMLIYSLYSSYHTEITSFIVSILPNAEEIALIKQHTDVTTLDDASKLYFHFNRVPRLTMRIECHEIAFSWGTTAATTVHQLHVLQRACMELSGSEKNIQTLFSMVLAIGKCC